MLGLRLSTALLLATTCLLLTAGFSGAVSTRRAVTCTGPNFVHQLGCDSGVISVQTALYGRADRTTCSEGRPPQQLANTQCSQAGAVDTIKKSCDGRRMCQINIDIFSKSDPCYGIYKYLETTYTCVPAIHTVACEHSLANLQCGDNEVIFVYGAEYGRHTPVWCSYQRPVSQIRNVQCSGRTDKVAARCNGKNSCTIAASNSVFGDPCVGTYKYLEVAYTCRDSCEK